MIPSYPKIFQIGDRYIKDIWNDVVEITCKLDGSMFCFGKIDDQLHMRSKNAIMYTENPQTMFKLAVDYVVSIQDRLDDNTSYYCEYIQKPKHNCLKYDRVPKNHLMLFGVCRGKDNFISSYSELSAIAETLDIDIVPLLHYGKVDENESIQLLQQLLEIDSYLGGTKVEGIVVKNYEQSFLIGGQIIPLMMGKFVSPKFKEVHQREWTKDHTNKGRWEIFKDGYRTEARWMKAIQHLRDEEKLEFSPRDIGQLIKTVQNDIIIEEKENIKDGLWGIFKDEILRHSYAGFPEFYKQWLMEQTHDQ